MFTGTTRSVPLHTFKPESGRQWTYSSTKIGGHPFDHPGGLGEMTDLWSAPPRRRFGGLPASFWVALEEAQCSEAAPNTAHNPQASSSPTQGPGCRDNHAHRGPEGMASPTPWMGLEEFTVYRRYLESLCRQRRLPPPVFSAPQQQQDPTGACVGGHDLTLQPAAHILGAGAAYPHHHHEVMERESRRWKRPRGGLGPMAGLAVAAASVYKYLRKTGAPSLETGGTLRVGFGRLEDGNEVLLDKLVEPLSDVEAWSARVASAPRWSQLRRYTFVRSLGKGAHAETFLVERHGVRYVLKESSALPEAVNEARLLSQVNEANVVRLEDFFIELLGGMRHVAYLQLEYCDGGDLASLITRGTEYGVLALDDHTISSIVVQVANGLKAMHAKHIIHRDLKPENILLTTEGLVKIADLGVSTRLTASLPTTTTAAGSVPFMAPEVRRFLLGEDVSYTEKADIWALGAVTYAMCCSIPVPNLAKMPPELAVAEVMAHRGWPPTTPRSAVSERLCSLMLHTLQPSSESRPSAEGCRAMLLADVGLEDDTRPLQAILSKLSSMLCLLALLLVVHVAHNVVADGGVEAPRQHTNLRPPSRHGRVNEAVDTFAAEHPSRHMSNHWAVLVAGSNTYMNYRHQADVYHAYHLLVFRGVPESQIVVFHYDDIAGHPANPIKGQVFNRPGGPDVYARVPKDYTGENVNKNTFLAVLRGEVVNVGSGKTLKTTRMSHIFVYYADHGSVGLVSMPVGGYLYADELRGAIKELHANRRFSKFVFYLEACESGSMFEELPLDLRGVYTMTASNANEPSYACYWNASLSTYMGDCYSVNWLEDSDRADMRKETVEDQFEKVRNETSTSHVCQYGDKDVATEVLALFQGNKILPFEPAPNRTEDGVAAATRMPVSQRDVRIRYLSHRVSTAKDTEGFEEAVRELSEEVRSRDRADQRFARALSGLMATPALVDSVAPDCLRRSVEGTEELCGRFSEYSLKYVRYLYDSCRRGVDADKIVGVMREVCTRD